MTSDILAEVVRNGFRESWHRGSLVALAADGAPGFEAGFPELPMFPRSASKPLQAAGMLRAGLGELPGLREEWIALAAASHSGEQVHRCGVQALLAAAGLSETDLGNVADLPIGDAERKAWRRQGRSPTPLAMNCSGKHAAMLATCVVRGWPLTDYLDAGHPLQLALRATVEDLAGEPVPHTGVDGCGAPLFALTLTGLARAFAALLAGRTAAERRVAAAMVAHPDLVAGPGRDVTALMRLLPGSIAKDGAEGVYAMALPDGRTVVLKVDDGAARPRVPVLVAALRRLGADAHGLDTYARVPVYGGGQIVGELRAASL